ncbi:MAG: CoA ester lyase, partial [Ilumatobacteraceae bacterium]
YMPGANARALEKAATLPADALILDLEDAVAPDAKVEARDRVCDAARSGRYGRRVVTIRANGLGTQWHDDDIVAIAAAGVDAVVVPKINSASDVAAVVASLDAAGASESTAVWAMVETPVAMLHAHEIATATDRLTVLVMGTNDLAKELGAQYVPGRAPLVTGLSLCLLAARAAGTVILDGVYNDVRDPEGFAAECAQGRAMGFDGKTLIHPSQVEPCNEAFAPAADELARSHEIIEAFEAAQAEGRGVVTVEGRMIENLHVEQARQAIAKSEAIAALRSDAG